ncbi:M28 family metallopeptidase [Actinoplanes teichomyceticus]|uniref:Zn-dependent M28 family amino/carboxypeptidase n=1 Tax=Actinoplanes teichomyceticus TaxID=1867 RepID=A0A561W9D3_ACTTI|nr:M28 family metallopeptidase [Actinoplanes teichomyceticus]TWG20474.1 Zn-dependent M28 family amino/carboxypeptidase [Actinoplanes teichomyceticus]GIF14039.1 aminopeptidase [Actinoplanes teichomyceticus]
MRRRILAVPLAAALIVTLAPQPASAVDEVNTKKLRDAVTVAGILGHERVLQRIATRNDGTRASGTPGFAASAAYVSGVLKNAGYRVTEQKFTFAFYRELAPAQLTPVAPAGPAYATATYEYSASGDVTGRVVPALNNVLPPTPEPSSTAGCAAGDFAPASATAPEIALIQRGGCDFAVKAANAAAAGYDAAIIFNEGQPGRTELFQGTLGGAIDIPVVGLSFADGSALAAAAASGTVTLRVRTSTEINPNATTSNIIADSPAGDPDRVLVVGAHLDSVVEGAGINDNGSGSATILEIAVQMAKLKIKPRQQVRFAFWGAEEAGLLGSEHYVADLSDTELTHIFANLNFDMVGSPNYVRFVYDGDGSATGTSGPAGSERIESLFTDYFAGRGLASDPSEFNGRSDYGPFIEAGIPAGGLFSGAEGVKTPEQAAVYGGTAGAPYDACYHQACDDIDNLNTTALAELGDAAAHAVLTLARTKTGLYPDGSLRARARAAAPDFPYRGGHLVR